MSQLTGHFVSKHRLSYPLVMFFADKRPTSTYFSGDCETREGSSTAPTLTLVAPEKSTAAPSSPCVVWAGGWAGGARGRVQGIAQP